MRQHLDKFIHHSIRLVYPPTCVHCQSPGHDELDICYTCLKSLTRNSLSCPTCGLPLSSGNTLACGKCLKHPPSLDHVISPFIYEGILTDIISGLKYQRRIASARLLGMLMSPQCSQRSIDLIIPVPAHRQSLISRGYNQAQEIAKAISKSTGIPVNGQLIIKARQTQRQSQLKARERQANLAHSFELSGNAVTGKRVAVVDDVMTTGGTLNSIAQTLKQGGAAHVEGWAAARTLLN